MIQAQALAALLERDPLSARLLASPTVSMPVPIRRSPLAAELERGRLDVDSEIIDVIQKRPAGLGYAIACWSKGHRVGDTIAAEAAARALAVALGSPFDSLVPPAALQSGIGKAVAVLIEYRDGDVGSRRVLANVEHDQAMAAALFDAVIGQQDRHLRNFLWDDGERRLTLIDHSFAFAGRRTLRLYSCFERGRRRDPAASRLTAAERAALERLATPDLLGLRPALPRSAADALAERIDRILAADGLTTKRSYR